MKLHPLLILAAAAAAVIPALAQEMPAPVPADSTGIDSAVADSARAGAAPDRIASLEKEIIPVIRRSCSVSGCHQGDRPKAGLDLSADDLRPVLLDVPSRQVKEMLLVDSKNPDGSYLLMKVAGAKGIKGRKMPVGNVPDLGASEISLFADWVRNFGRAEKKSEP